MHTKCTATTKAGKACQAWALPGTDPPRCYAHGARPPRPPDPLPHPDPLDLRDICAQMAERLAYVRRYIADRGSRLPPTELRRWNALHGQLLTAATRIAHYYRLTSIGQTELERLVGSVLHEIDPDLVP